jgi:hypothetical protein
MEVLHVPYRRKHYCFVWQKMFRVRLHASLLRAGRTLGFIRLDSKSHNKHDASL